MPPQRVSVTAMIMSRRFCLMLSLAAAVAYLWLSVAMTGNDVVVRNGIAYATSDLCVPDADDSHDCPFCALAKATVLPVAPRSLGLSLIPAAAEHRRWSDQIRDKYDLRARPPVRAPPFMSV